MGYLTLAQHHGKYVWRSLQRQRRWLITLALTPLVLYVLFALGGLGIHFDMLPFVSPSEGTPFEIVNDNLLAALIGLFVLRFVLQRPPRLNMQPYLHLPIRSTTLVRYFQLASLGSSLNVLPLFFLIPFWLHHVVDVVPLAGAIIWLIGVVTVLVVTHFVNNIARVLLDHNTRTFLAILALLLCVLAVDQTLGNSISREVSSAVFSSLAAGSLLTLGILVAGCIALGMGASHILHHALRSPSRISRTQRGSGTIALNFGKSSLWNLIILEWKLMRRTKRPRQYAFVSIVLAMLYTGLLLSDLNVIRGPVVNAFLGLFASGAFALNYGQLMFAWESRYFDGLLARAIHPHQMVLAKLMLLQISCLVMFFLCLPLFIWLAPRLLSLHVTFLFYNAGVTCLLMLVLAIRNQKRVSTSDGHFFNYQGFSIWHWLWLIPTLAPPALLLIVLSDQTSLAMATIALVGLVNMLLAWPWCKLFGRQLERRRYVMADGFRGTLE